MRHSFDVVLAEKIGIEASIILCQFEFWIEKNKENKKNFKDGKYWTYNTVKELKNTFTYMTERQINYTIAKLKQLNLIEQGCFNKHNLDRTIWYTLTTEGEAILQNCKMEKTPILQNCKMQFTNLSNASYKNVKSQDNTDNINNSLKPNQTQIIPESNNNAPTRKGSAPKFEELKKFAQENSLSTLVNKFWKYYQTSNWLDKEGHPFNWKQKLLSWGNSEGLVVGQAQEYKKNFKERKREDYSDYFTFPDIDDIEV